MTKEFRSLLMRFAVTLFAAIISGGCDSTDHTNSTVIAENQKWSVVAIGQLSSPAERFWTEVVRFQAMRRGQVYAEGRLYENHSNEPPFNHRFSRTEWIGEDALRFLYPPNTEVPSLTLVVHNASGRTIKWVRLQTDELFLLFDVSRGETVSLPLFRRGDYVGFVVDGELDDGRLVKGEVRTSKGSFRKVRLTVNEGDVNLSAEDVPTAVEVPQRLP